MVRTRPGLDAAKVNGQNQGGDHGIAGAHLEDRSLADARGNLERHGQPAAHLAFADEAEQGVRLPLFLDEALDQSDPVRFEAIARSLARMVEDEGRQLFYLTSDPTDMRRIQEALDKEGCAAARTIVNDCP